MPTDKFRKSAQHQENMAAVARIQCVSKDSDGKQNNSQKMSFHGCAPVG